MEHEQEKLRPPQILLKPEWGKILKYLTTKDSATVFKNIFRYYEGEPLEKMSPMATMFFTSVEEVMNYNQQRYQNTVDRNRNNGNKSKGRPSNSKPSETQENPVGNVEYPENPKDKAIDKDRDKTKAKTNNKAIENNKTTSSTRLNQKQEEILEIQLKQLTERDWEHIKDREDALFIQSCILLANEVSWERFIYMIKSANRDELKQLVELYNVSLLPEEILELRKHCVYYLNKLLPQVPSG